MLWDREKFISEASELFDNDAHKKSIEARLPNDGDELSKICSVGFAQLERNFDTLASALTAK